MDNLRLRFGITFKYFIEEYGKNKQMATCRYRWKIHDKDHKGPKKAFGGKHTFEYTWTDNKEPKVDKQSLESSKFPT